MDYSEVDRMTREMGLQKVRETLLCFETNRQKIKSGVLEGLSQEEVRELRIDFYDALPNPYELSHITPNALDRIKLEKEWQKIIEAYPFNLIEEAVRSILNRIDESGAFKEMKTRNFADFLNQTIPPDSKYNPCIAWRILLEAKDVANISYDLIRRGEENPRFAKDPKVWEVQFRILEACFIGISSAALDSVARQWTR